MYDCDKEKDWLKRRIEMKQYLDKALASVPFNDKEAVIAALGTEEAVAAMLGILMDGEWGKAWAEVEDTSASRFAAPGVRLDVSAVEANGTVHSFDVLWTANDNQPVPIRHTQVSGAL